MFTGFLNDIFFLNFLLSFSFKKGVGAGESPTIKWLVQIISSVLFSGGKVILPYYSLQSVNCKKYAIYTVLLTIHSAGQGYPDDTEKIVQQMLFVCSPLWSISLRPDLCYSFCVTEISWPVRYQWYSCLHRRDRKNYKLWLADFPYKIKEGKQMDYSCTWSVTSGTAWIKVSGETHLP